MKVVLLFLFFTLALFGCSKDKDEPAKTYIFVTNNTDYDLSNVVMGEVDWSARKAKLIYNWGTIKKGTSTVHGNVDNGRFEWVYLYFDGPGVTFMLNDGYLIIDGQVNNLIITNTLKVSEVKKTDNIYPK